MREIPKPYERYRHFKGKDYQIIATAKSADDLRDLVVYQGLYEPYEIYVRDLQEFLSPVDRAKYPEAEQEERFRKLTGTGAAEAADIRSNAGSETLGIRSNAGPETAGIRSNAGPEAADIRSNAGAEAVMMSSGSRSEDTGKTAAADHAADSCVDTKDTGSRPLPPTGQMTGAGKSKTAEETAVQAYHEPAAQAHRETAGERARKQKPGIDPVLLRFLDAETDEEKLAVLSEVRELLTPALLTPMELSLGMEPQEGVDQDIRFKQIRNTLQYKQKYERSRRG